MKNGFLGACVVLAIAAFASSQSLGEIAKKAADAKAAKGKDGKATPPIKTVTDKDLKADPHPPAQTKATDQTPEPPAPGSPLPATAPIKDETWWKDRMRTLQARLSANQTELVAATAHVADVEAFIRPDGTMSHTIANNLLAARGRQDKAVAAITNDKRAITELEEEARRAGVPPGWLRW